MHWLQLTTRVHPDAVEAVTELLSRYTTEGIAIEEPIELIHEGQEYRLREGEPFIVHAYTPVDGKEEEVCKNISEGLWHLASIGSHFVSDLERKAVVDDDWAHSWKEHFHVTHIGKHIVIRPSWRDYLPEEHEVVITLDPGMAFGTGLHATTRMCLELIETHVKPGMRVLDVGTGSGILSLFAAKFGASRVYGIDNSSVAVESARENAKLNQLEHQVEIIEGILDQTGAQRMQGEYDLVVANIIAEVIGSIANELATVLAPGGQLIVSGIIEARLSYALQPLEAAGLEVVERVMIEDWLALVLRKREE